MAKVFDIFAQIKIAILSMKGILGVLLFLTVAVCFAQNDCVDAIVVCGNNNYEDLNATGVGVQELSGSNTCSSQENNSLWLSIKINSGGTLGFEIIPTHANGTTNTDINIDFDFFIFGPNATCSNIGQAIRCSTTNPSAAGQGNNLTGLRSSESDTAEGPGSDGNSFVNWLNVNSGERYFLVIDRPIGSSNFKIDWTGSSTFNAPPIATRPAIGSTYNLEECDADGVLDNATEFDLTVNNIGLINGQTDVEVHYFENNNDAQTGNNAIVSPSNFVNTSDPQTIYTRITSTVTDCFAVSDFLIDIKGGLNFTAQNINVCDTDNIWDFDLTVNDASILNGMQNASVLYYTNENDALNNVNDILGLFRNTSNPQIIWARLESVNVGCFGVESFNIEIFDTPIATRPPNMVLCDDDNNGTTPFDLTFQNGLINTESGMLISYHLSQNDADLNLNSITSPFESGFSTIFARVENSLHTVCYDTTSFDIEVYDSPFPLDSASISNLSFCDNTSIGSDTDGLIVLDLTLRGTDILNGQSATDFTLTYFTDSNFNTASEILDPTNFTNTIVGGQTVYVQMVNVLSQKCSANTSFILEVFEIPVIQPTMTFKNCDEDGNPDGFTDYNLDEANDYITNGNANLTVTYHLTKADADAGSNAVNPAPFNNTTASTVYARAETVDGCHRVSTVDLQVSTTSFPAGYNYALETCDDDDTIDGLYLFDLTQASADMISQFPTGQNLSVHYYRNLVDAQLEQNEIASQTNYMSEVPYNQTLYVRVESNDNGACFGVGPFLGLAVFPRPEFEVIPEAVVCLNLPPITLEAFNPKDVYTYEWTDENDIVISTEATVDVATGGVYTVIATSGLNCQSFPQTVTVRESIVATIDHDDVTITDDSANNTVSINNENNKLGIGDYEFSLDDAFGPYQDESTFESVMPGLHAIYVRDKNSCGLATLEISVIGFPKFFTPNNDGHNDTWSILGVSQGFYPTSLIYIYNRFGKILAKVDPLGSGWDGFYNGTQLPSDDYWFSVQLIDTDGITKNRKGHFSLMRK